MLTVAKQKLIASLQQKKSRIEHRLFVVEGVKIISEFILKTDFVTELVVSDISLFSEDVLSCAKKKNIEINSVDEKVIKKISSLSTPQNCVALAKMPEYVLDFTSIFQTKIIALDTIQDPGNLGTIIRSADWFGIRNIVCSNDTVDCYNPKVVQASMGSLSNVHIYYTNLNEFLSKAHGLKVPIYGTLLNGKDINTTSFSKSGILLLGNEANGISEENCSYISEAVTIAKAASAYAESLNVAVAAAICCSKWQ